VLSSCEDGRLTIRNITLVITGHRPMGWLERGGPRYLFVDADLNRLDRQQNLPDLYFTASCRYSRLISWKGKGQIPSSDQQRLTALVDRAHAIGAKVRLWGSPDKARVWNFLMSCGVDLINTDRLVALRDYFTRSHWDDHSEAEPSPGQ
jgi:glycerophosphoryl diester phosphodiesterase